LRRRGTFPTVDPTFAQRRCFELFPIPDREESESAGVKIIEGARYFIQRCHFQSPAVAQIRRGLERALISSVVEFSVFERVLGISGDLPLLSMLVIAVRESETAF